ncbi:MAG: hypothetical protein IJY88_02560 [Clostridia bacterium]|nr:hypothetical protein [Clostridia bacterium]
MNTEEKNGSQEKEVLLAERAPIPFSFLLFPIILVILSIVFSISYNLHMNYEGSGNLNIYCTVALIVFALEAFALHTANDFLYKIATSVTSIFLIVQPAFTVFVGLSKSRSLYTYSFVLLSYALLLIAVAMLFYHLREERLNLNSKVLPKVLFAILAISFGIMNGTTVLRYTYVFSVIAAFISFLSPLSIFLPLSLQKKNLFRIIKIANIVLLIWLFLFYIDMFLVIFEASPFNLGEHSQLYNLYEIYFKTFLVVPENYPWLYTQFLDAFFEILYPIVLLVNVGICHDRQTETENK